MTVGGVIEAVKNDLAKRLTPLIEAEGEKNLARYVVGNPDNQNDTFCCVLLFALRGKETLEFILHLALPAVPEAAAYNYIEAARNYLDAGFSAYDYGYDSHEWELLVRETDFSSGDIQALFNVTMTRRITDCD